MKARPVRTKRVEAESSGATKIRSESETVVPFYFPY
jgi:hypothetical protein